MKYIYYLFICIITLSATTKTLAQPVVIEGKSKAYAGDVLTFEILTDFFTKQSDTLHYMKTENRYYKNLPIQKATGVPIIGGVYNGPVFFDYDTTFEIECKVKENGEFMFEFEVDRTCFATLNLAAYRGFIFLEKSKKYTISLPPKRELHITEKLNPYFKPEKFYIDVKNAEKHDLNTLIPDFEYSYNDIFIENSMITYKKGRNLKIDSMISVFDEQFAHFKNSYFTNYKKYRYDALRYMALGRDPENLMNDVFASTPVLYEVQSYMDLLGQTSLDILSHIMKKKSGKKLTQLLNNSQSLDSLKNEIQINSPLKKDTLIELILLKALYDGFYKKEFSAKNTLAIFDLVIEQSDIPLNVLIAKGMKGKMSKLLPGSKAPGFELYDEDSVMAKLDLFKGKYLYLNFFSSHSYSCRQDLPILQKLYHKHKEKLEIITISIDYDFQSTLKIAEMYDYTWTFLRYDENSTILKDYDVAAYPSYYLIDPDGNLVLSPAPAPNREFEERFFQVWDNRRKQRMRSGSN